MKTIAILSDTHGLLRKELLTYLEQADVILHAGDIGAQTIVDTLQSYAPTYAVQGNNDVNWAQSLPQQLHFCIERIRFFLVHKKTDVPKDLTDVDVIVYGHSHRYAASEQSGVFWLNPGSCGRRRFQQETSLCMMQAENGAYQLEKILIPPEAGSSAIC